MLRHIVWNQSGNPRRIQTSIYRYSCKATDSLWISESTSFVYRFILPAPLVVQGNGPHCPVYILVLSQGCLNHSWRFLSTFAYAPVGRPVISIPMYAFLASHTFPHLILSSSWRILIVMRERSLRMVLKSLSIGESSMLSSLGGMPFDCSVPSMSSTPYLLFCPRF